MDIKKAKRIQKYYERIRTILLALIILGLLIWSLTI